MKSGRVSALALVAAIALPLHAQAASQGFSYTGFYGGVDLGASSLSNTVKYGALTIDQGTTGLAYDGHVGYGVQGFQNPWYTGAELSGGSQTGTMNLAFGSDATISEKQNWNLALDARVGRVVDQNTLIYGKLGWGHAEFNQSWSGSAYAAPGSVDKAFNGVRFGGGLESRITDGFTGRIEGVYTSYGSQTFDGTTYSPSSVSVVAGLNYHFQWTP